MRLNSFTETLLAIIGEDREFFLIAQKQGTACLIVDIEEFLQALAHSGMATAQPCEEKGSSWKVLHPVLGTLVWYYWRKDKNETTDSQFGLSVDGEPIIARTYHCHPVPETEEDPSGETEIIEIPHVTDPETHALMVKALTDSTPWLNTQLYRMIFGE